MTLETFTSDRKDMVFKYTYNPHWLRVEEDDDGSITITSLRPYLIFFRRIPLLKRLYIHGKYTLTEDILRRVTMAIIDKYPDGVTKLKDGSTITVTTMESEK